MTGLDGRIAAVTGAGQGIGRAVAERLASEGASVLVTDLLLDRAIATAKHIQARGNTAQPVKVDVCSSDDLAHMLSLSQSSFGTFPDTVVCNAGYQTFGNIMELGYEEWDKVMAVNVMGTFETMRTTARAMRSTGIQGSIIAIASIQARLGSVYYAHYSASKAAVLSITKSMALAMAPAHIRVNAVAPGMVDTDLWATADRNLALLRGVKPGVPKAERIAQIPLGRAGTPEDVAGVVAFLASDDASYLTGECIHICGGDLML